jgi:hypothetical protein
MSSPSYDFFYQNVGTFTITELPTSVNTVSASGISVNKDGVVIATLSGNLTDLGGALTADGWYDFGTNNVTYGHNTTNTTYTSVGIKTGSLSLSNPALSPVHYRFNATNIGLTTYGSDSNFTLTMPTVGTGIPTVSQASQTGYHFILNGSISDMGVASSTNYAFRWGYSPTTMTNIAGAGVASGVGSFSADIGNILAGKTVYYQFYTTVGAVEASGSTQNGTGATTPTVATSFLLPLLVLLTGIVVILKMMANQQISGLKGLLLMFIIIAITVALLVPVNTIVTTP